MKELILKFIKKYPITFVSVLSFAVLAIMMMSYGDVYTVTKETETLYELLMLSFHLIFGSFFFYKVLDNYKDKLPTKISNNRIIINVITLILPVVLYILSRLIFNFYMEDGIYGAYNLVIIYVSITYYLIVKENNIVLHEYLTKVFMNTLYLFLVYCVVAGGIGVLLYIYTILFGEINWKYIMYIYIYITVNIGYIGYFITIDETNQKLTIFAKVLVKYIMMIMVLIGFVFFYIYLFGIIVSRQMPSNQVYTVCTVLFSVGLLVALMSRTFEDNKIYDNTIKYLPLAFIPALIMQIISLYIRISKYGFTKTRYLGVFFIIFEIIYIIYYMYKYEKLRFLFIVEAIMFFAMCFVPFINQYQFPKFYNSHLARYNNISVVDEDSNVKKYKTAHGYRYERFYEQDVEGYKTLYDADIHIEYNNKEEQWQNYNQTSKKMSDFTAVNVIDNDSKVITTMDISDFLNKIKDNILKYDYTNDDDKIFENIDSYILNDGKKYYINSIHVYYNEEISNFTEVIMYGDLLVK